MFSFRFYLVTGIVVLVGCFFAQRGTAQTVSLYQQLSVPTAEFSPFRGQTPTLNFTPMPIESCSSVNPWKPSYSCLTIPSEPRLSGSWCERSGRYVFGRVWSDHRNFYSLDTALNYGVALAGAAILANTPLDRRVSEWYQNEVRSPGTDDFAKFWKYFGEAHVWVPIFAVSAISYRLHEQSDWNKRRTRYLPGEYAARTTRAYLVGTPSLWFFQSMLGSGRPSMGAEKGSYWRPFKNDNAVSGHSFIGAMPFITAAQMVEKPWLKGVFYACSVLPAWSRVNDNAHYLSQAILGWYLAYLSARAVSQTEDGKLPRGLTIFPITDGPYVGFGFLYKR